MYEPRELLVHTLDTDNPLRQFGDTRQLRYLQAYLRELGATWAVEEPYYFDRDYLAEFSAFYSVSARGYRNVCRRLHFFGGPAQTRQGLLKVLCEDSAGVNPLQDNYLGFTVIRPIPGAPLGRTVLKQYPDANPGTPRVLTPARDYVVHVAGLRLHVRGLAWAQQDAAVGACATIALWTMFHASAFDEHHAIPTTAAITLSANRFTSLGARIFPSDGLTVDQIGAAIKEHGLVPLVIRGREKTVLNYPTDSAHFTLNGFRPEYFSSFCATMVRSGYPVLIGATRLPDTSATGTRPSVGATHHATCLVGFRSWSPVSVKAGDVVLEDSKMPFVYLHDDNLGPNARHRLYAHKETGLAALAHDPPERPLAGATSDQAGAGFIMIPDVLILGLHEGIRISVDALHKRGISLAQRISKILAEQGRRDGRDIGGIRLGIRIQLLREYLGTELDRMMPVRSLRGQLRAMLVESVPPMSLHLGLVRLVLDERVILDLLHDTTDSKLNTLPFACVTFDHHVSWLVERLWGTLPGVGGVHIKAHEAVAPRTALARA